MMRVVRHTDPSFSDSILTSEQIEKYSKENYLVLFEVKEKDTKEYKKYIQVLDSQKKKI